MPTRQQNEQAVLERIRECGGATVYWLTENQARACAVDRLVERGVIVQGRDDCSLWCEFMIVNDSVTIDN